MSYSISNTTKFQKELKDGQIKDQVGLFIQYYNINLLLQNSLLLKEFLIFHCLNEDDERFRLCLIRYLNHINKIQQKLEMLIESLEKKQFNFNSAEYPVQTKTIQK